MIFNRPRRREKKRLTWYFDSKLSVASKEFSVNFRSATSNRLYHRIQAQPLVMVYTYSGGGKDQVYMMGKWRNETDRTITFEEEPTGDLLAFLEANATPQ